MRLIVAVVIATLFSPALFAQKIPLTPTDPNPQPKAVRSQAVHAKAQPELLAIPATIVECEGSECSKMGAESTWFLAGSGGHAHWSNNSEAILRVKRFDAEQIVIERVDTARSATPGALAVYAGVPHGNRVDGVMIIQTADGKQTEQKWYGTLGGNEADVAAYYWRDPTFWAQVQKEQQAKQVSSQKQRQDNMVAMLLFTMMMSGGNNASGMTESGLTEKQIHDHNMAETQRRLDADAAREAARQAAIPDWH